MIFKIGEVAILRNCEKYPYMNGEAVIIAGELEPRIGNDGSTVWGHVLTLRANGVDRFAMIRQLDKAPTPSQGDRLTKVSWTDCAWQPYHKPDCMALAIELHRVRLRTAFLRRGTS